MHVTPARLLVSIQEHGLVPSIGPRSRQLSEDLPRIYLFADEAAAHDGVASWLGELFEDHDTLALLAVDTHGLTLTPTFHDIESWEWSCLSPIDPSRISIHCPDF